MRKYFVIVTEEEIYLCFLKFVTENIDKGTSKQQADR